MGIFVLSCLNLELIEEKSVVVQYQGTCVSSFIPSNNLLPGAMVVGTPFLRAWHAQFNYNVTTDKAQIGFSVPVNTASAFGAAVNNPLGAAGRRKLSQLAQAPPSMATLMDARIEDPTIANNLFSAYIPSASSRGLE